MRREEFAGREDIIECDRMVRYPWRLADSGRSALLADDKRKPGRNATGPSLRLRSSLSRGDCHWLRHLWCEAKLLHHRSGVVVATLLDDEILRVDAADEGTTQVDAL